MNNIICCEMVITLVGRSLMGKNRKRGNKAVEQLGEIIEGQVCLQSNLSHRLNEILLRSADI